MNDAPATIRLLLNGEPREVAGTSTVADLLEQLLVDRRQVAVERNRVLVPKGDFEVTRLADGDELEIVSFVGGG